MTLFEVMYWHLRKLPAPRDVRVLRTAVHRLPGDLLKLILGLCPDTRYAILAGKVFYREFERSLGDCVYKDDQEIQDMERSQAEEGKCSAEIFETTMKETYSELAKLNRKEREERYTLLIRRLFHGQVRVACLKLIGDRATVQENYSVGEDVAPRYEEKVKRVVDVLCEGAPEKVKDALLRINPSAYEIVLGMKETFNEYDEFVGVSGDSKEA